MEPVGMTSIARLGRLPRRMMEPFPNFFSILPTAKSRALSLSTVLPPSASPAAPDRPGSPAAREQPTPQHPLYVACIAIRAGTPLLLSSEGEPRQDSILGAVR